MDIQNGNGFAPIQDSAHQAKPSVNDGDDDSMSRDEFIEGAVNAGVPRQQAEDTWDANFGASTPSVNAQTFNQSNAGEDTERDLDAAAAGSASSNETNGPDDNNSPMSAEGGFDTEAAEKLMALLLQALNEAISSNQVDKGEDDTDEQDVSGAASSSSV